MTTKPEQPISFLRLPEVQKRTGLKRSTIYARIALGQFPAGVRLTTRNVGWLDNEISAWINERVRASRGVAEERQ